ncbi:MAG: YceI family protein [candidate division KSB1 bacterium]|nr:YceI family protein [candidate division KSB1 bacterium]MDQ7066255.1 YceI family protein [candidate division KSB1 bacterium]
MFKKSLTVVILGLLLVGTALSADRYQIDPVHSSIAFSVRHMVINKVKGNFKEFTGTILYDEKDISKSSVSVTIQAASIDTDNSKRDDHLRSADFFDVQKYPTITFKSKRIVKEGDGYVAIGDLTMHGVTREVRIPFQILGKVVDPWGNTRIGVEASLILNRHDFGISWSKTLDNGGLVVGNEVMIELNIEAIKQK